MLIIVEYMLIGFILGFMSGLVYREIWCIRHRRNPW